MVLPGVKKIMVLWYGVRFLSREKQMGDTLKYFQQLSSLECVAIPARHHGSRNLHPTYLPAWKVYPRASLSLPCHCTTPNGLLLPPTYTDWRKKQQPLLFLFQPFAEASQSTAIPQKPLTALGLSGGRVAPLPVER